MTNIDLLSQFISEDINFHAGILVEARIDPIDDDDLYHTIWRLDDKQMSRFAVFCANDCFKLNDNITREAAQNCINVAEMMASGTIDDDLRQAVYHDGLQVLYPDNNGITGSHSACNALRSAMCAVGDIGETMITNAYRAAYNAAEAYSNSNNYVVFNEKLDEYKQVALGLLTRRTNKERSQILQRTHIHDRDTIALAIEQILNDTDEYTPNDFFYVDGNDIVFDLGNKRQLRADSVYDLTDLIIGNKYWLDRFNDLYDCEDCNIEDNYGH